MVNAMKL